ncbi:MAG: ThiF family adenylyltransferase [Planctomycetota bacterium]
MTATRPATDRDHGADVGSLSGSEERTDRMKKMTANAGPEENRETRPQSAPTALDLSLIRERRIVIVGIGGIGSFLAPLLVLFLSSLRGVRVHVSLVDGDTYEERNRERMDVPELGNKAEVLSSRLSARHGRPRLYIRPVDRYVTEENVAEVIQEHDIVFSCVDNHATRKILSERCAQLDDVILISGGNDGVEEGSSGTYGNVQIFQRRGGEELNPPLTRFHPEIENPADEVPGLSCEDLASTTVPQIVFTNFFAAAVMGAAFHRILGASTAREIYDEACFDIAEGRMLPHVM